MASWIPVCLDLHLFFPAQPLSLFLSDYFSFWSPSPASDSGTIFFYATALRSLLRIVFILIGVAYFTLAERKIMGAVQRRRGPNIVGIFGLLQPLADGLKLLCKEMVIPSKSNTIVFLIAPLAIIILSLISWVVIPFSPAYSLTPTCQTPDWFIGTLIANLLITGKGISAAELLIPARNFYYPMADLNLSILFIL